MTRRRALPLALLLFSAGCSEPQTAERHAFFALGTLVKISVFAPPAGFDDILRDTETALLAEENRWRAFESGELADINAALATGEAVEISEPVLAGIKRAQEIANASGGRFNPAIGNLVSAWNFHVEERPSLPPPDTETISALLPAPTLAALEKQQDGRWKSRDAKLWIDMGAFAKGLAVDTAIELLHSRGVNNAIVNAGGDLKAIGQHGDRAWRVGIRSPRGRGVLAALEIHHGESVFTSGDYERHFEWDGKRYHHILDPATGQPAQGVVSVTVIHPDAALSDAAATALFVAGPGEWTKTAHDLGIDKAMIVLENGSIQLTAMMRERVTFEDDASIVEVIAP